MESGNGEGVIVKFHVGVGDVGNNKGIGEFWIQEFSIGSNNNQIGVDDFTFDCSSTPFSFQNTLRIELEQAFVHIGESDAD